ncbi:MAG: hypothetical protein ACLUPK_01715 [Veillonella sp.]
MVAKRLEEEQRGLKLACIEAHANEEEGQAEAKARLEGNRAASKGCIEAQKGRRGTLCCRS